MFVSAYALGRLAVVGVRDVRHARHRAVRKQELAAAAVPATDIRRHEPTTVVDEVTPSEDNPYASNPNDTVVLPQTPAHASSGSTEDTTRLDAKDI